MMSAKLSACSSQTIASKLLVAPEGIPAGKKRAPVLESGIAELQVRGKGRDPMDSMAEQAVCTAAAGEMPRFADGTIDLRELAESVIDAVMDAEAEEMCPASGNSRNGYRPRTLSTCVGTLNLRIPRFRKGSFFPDDILERCQRTDRALIAAVAEMYETGTSTRKVQRIAERMGIGRLSKDQASSMARSLDADVGELLARPLGDLAMPRLWLDATYVKCRRERHVSSTAIVTAIGCDADGWRRILGLQPSTRSRTAPGKGSSRRCVREAWKASSWSRAMPMRA